MVNDFDTRQQVARIKIPKGRKNQEGTTETHVAEREYQTEHSDLTEQRPEAGEAVAARSWGNC